MRSFSIPDFTSLSGNVFVKRKILSTPISGKHDESQPTTIMIFGWGDAAPRHLLKYSSMYSKMYPSSEIILVVSSSAAALTRTRESARKSMLPVAKLLLPASGQSDTNTKVTLGQPRVLIHAFSNTGLVNLVATCETYRSLVGPHSFLPHDLLILDSTPGGDSFWKELTRLCRVLATGLSSSIPLPRSVLILLSALVLVCIVGIPALFGIENIARSSKRALNHPKLSSTGPERLYIYSESDDLIGWRDVEEHASEALSRGWRVDLHNFRDTPHVQHMRKYPDTYWSIVNKAWESAAAKRNLS